MRYLIAFWLILLFAQPGFADHTPNLIPPDWGGTWMGFHPGVRVKVDPIQKGVTVTFNKDKDQVPKLIEITFFDADGNGFPLQLEAIEPWFDPNVTTESQLPGLQFPNPARFVGTLTPAAQSFVGFEIRVPLGGGVQETIRSEDLQRSD